MVRRSLATAFVLLAGLVLKAQQYPLAEVEVRMARHPHMCGMSGGTPCPRYEITIRGDGAVEYNGIGPVDGNRKRTISVDAVVSLVNEFLTARFLDARDAYHRQEVNHRHGDTVSFGGSGGSGPWVDLTLRIGDRRKSVRLERDYPVEIGKLPELVHHIGGPEAWQRTEIPAYSSVTRERYKCYSQRMSGPRWEKQPCELCNSNHHKNNQKKADALRRPPSYPTQVVLCVLASLR